MPPEEYKKEHFTHYFKRRFHTCLICKETMDWDRTIITGEKMMLQWSPLVRSTNVRSYRM